MTSLLANKKKRDKKVKRNHGSSLSGFNPSITIKQEYMEEEVVDSGNSSLDATPTNWDQNTCGTDGIFSQAWSDQIQVDQTTGYQLTESVATYAANETPNWLPFPAQNTNYVMTMMGTISDDDGKPISTSNYRKPAEFSVENTATPRAVNDTICPRKLSFKCEKDAEEEAGEETATEAEECRDETRIGLFSNEVARMMYGAGDECPYAESIKFLNDLAIDYITEVTCNAINVGKVGQIDVEDILHLTRNDAKKYSRVKSLIEVNEDLKSARRAFDVNSIANNSNSKMKEQNEVERE